MVFKDGMKKGSGIDGNPSAFIVWEHYGDFATHHGFRLSVSTNGNEPNESAKFDGQDDVEP